MPRKRALKPEVVDGIHKVRLGAYRVAGKEATNHTIAGTAVVRNRMPGGVGGRREQFRLLPDHFMTKLKSIQPFYNPKAQ